MLDIKFISQNPDIIKEGCKKKKVNIDIDRLLEIDKKRKEILQTLENTKGQKDKSSRKISQINNENERQKIISEMRQLDRNSDRLIQKLRELQTQFDNLMLQIPNLPQDDVPLGKDEKDNVVLREVGNKPEFNFEPKDHLEIGEKLDIIDIKRAAKISGARFSFLKKEAVLMEFALIKFAYDILIKEFQFIPIIPPIMLKSEMERGMGYLEHSGKEETYYLPQDGLYLVATAEHSIGAMHANEIFRNEALPKRYLGFSTCFRRESGSYGKDTRGIFRVHQFDKIEMFSFCKPEDSKKEHWLFLKIEEKLMKALKLPYRVVQICSGDMAFPTASQYDIETWMPSQNRYRETHSASNCTDFQARRLNIRYRNKFGKLSFIHTVNGTAFAIPRILISIIENYQQEGGSIKVPEILQKYMPKLPKVISNNL